MKAKLKLKTKESDEWYTPDWLAYQIQGVLGDRGIFDPCYKEGTPMAKVCCNDPDAPFVDATTDDWWKLDPARWYLNPPYSNPMPFVKSVIGYHNNTGAPGIVVVNSSTSAAWYQLLLKHCHSVCFPPFRIKFSRAPKPGDNLEVDEDGLVTPGAPRYNNSIFYFGDDDTDITERFYNEMWPSTVLKVQRPYPFYRSTEELHWDK